MNDIGPKDRSKFNITTKDPSRKQIIIPMNTNNSKRVITQTNKHISNINKLLKGVKSNVYSDYIHSDNKGIIITTNKVVASSDLNIIEKYVKELNNIDLNNVMSSWILQFKSYLKILDIPHF